MNSSFLANGAGDLWAITSFYNPIGYRRRLLNYREFRARLNVPLVAVELAFDRGFELAAGDADILIQLRGGDVMWQKERLLNLALAAVPPNCRKIAWVDSDVVFDRADWAEATSRLLDRAGIVQPFSHAYDIPPVSPRAGFRTKDAIAIRGGLVSAIESGGEPAATFAVQPEGGRRYARGFAWAARRELLERHGFFDECIIGGGDFGLGQRLLRLFRLSSPSPEPERAACGAIPCMGRTLPRSRGRRDRFAAWRRVSSLARDRRRASDP